MSWCFYLILRIICRRMQGEGAVTEESARVMLRRGMRWCEEKEGFLFTRDLRHRAMSLYGFPEEYLQIFAKAIKCPHLLIKVRKWHFENEKLFFTLRRPGVHIMKMRRKSTGFWTSTRRTTSLKWLQ